jgi:hypothetical protein
MAKNKHDAPALGKVTPMQAVIKRGGTELVVRKDQRKAGRRNPFSSKK